MAGQIHYEIFIRKTPPSSWTLAMATESRALAVETAEETLRSKLAVAVRVNKETLDPETRAYSSVTILTRGAPELKAKKVTAEGVGQAACITPADLYAPIARETLAEVLSDWLLRNQVTAYELLHRPDLAEKLDASGVELQHAIQKVAIPQSQSCGQSTHELIRHYQRLAEATVSKLVGAGRRDQFADVRHEPLAQIAEGLEGRSDRVFVMGGVLCRAIAAGCDAIERLGIMMDMADQAPQDGPGRALVFTQLEQILCDLLATRSGLESILGLDLDQGGSLAAAVRMAAPAEIEAVLRADPRIATIIPVVEGPAARLGTYLAAGAFPALTRSLARLVLRELMGPRRLRPSDAMGEVGILRALATTLTASAGRLLTLEEVQAAFVERSKALITADFIEACMSGCETALQEIEVLIRICENVTGPANKRSASRWLEASLSALKFENEMRAPGLHPVQKLAVLAGLQRSVRACAFADEDQERSLAVIGALGGMIEADTRLIVQMGRASAPALQRITALLRLAAGQTGPSGPVSERAKAEVTRLIRSPEMRSALAETPEALPEIRGLMESAGLAA